MRNIQFEYMLLNAHINIDTWSWNLLIMSLMDFFSLKKEHVLMYVEDMILSIKRKEPLQQIGV